jgi:AAA15 family ATPase/GTPase
MIDGLNTGVISTVQLWEETEYQEKIQNYMSKLGLGLAEINVTTRDFDSSELPKLLSDNAKNTLIKQLNGAKTFDIFAKHKIYSDQGTETSEFISWKFEDRESAGTNKAFHLSGPILWTLTNGGVLIIDEIEAKLHPIMTIETINLFLDKATNPKNAQLIFATHDTNLLTYSDLRRDQIYFCEKNKWESTEIYSLSDFVYLDNSKERPDTDKEKRYIEGRYGAIPVLSDFHSPKLVTNGEEG